jgi:two-component system response regulator
MLKKNNLVNKLKYIDDGAEALDFIFSKGAYADRNHLSNIRLVMLDIKLPNVEGLEILRQIKSNEQTKSIPVVILTSSQEEKDIIEGYRPGVTSYILKPVSFESFNKAVAELGFCWMILNQNANL